MKVTYLVFDDMGQLRVATKEEWNGIMEQNRTLSREQRRFFIQDCFEDCGILDCMYIETTREKYNKWHAANQRRYRQRQSSGDAEILSLDISTQTSADEAMIDIMGDGIDWEKMMLSGICLKELRCKLAAWRDWANELLDYYLAGEQMVATRILSTKYGLSEQLIRRRKRELESFIKNNFDFL
jgi:hypothetical protein